MLGGSRGIGTLDEAYRAVARLMFKEDRREPAWAPLLLEFWAHASRRERTTKMPHELGL